MNVQTIRSHSTPGRSGRLTLSLVVALVALAAAVVGAASAGEVPPLDVNASAGMTLAGAPLAIHGYDPVAFFDDGGAQIGDARFTVAHGGAAYRFVSQENLEAFEKAPHRYLPQFGGFCAYGVSVGAKFDGDPRVFEIVDGKLYFNLNPEIQATWKEDLRSNIRKADASWPTVRTRAAGVASN